MIKVQSLNQLSTIPFKKPFALIPTMGNLHAGHIGLLKTALKKNYRVGTYSLEEKSWIDIGNWLSYKNSIDKFSFFN